MRKRRSCRGTRRLGAGRIGFGVAVVHLFRFEHGLIAELWDIGQPVPEKSPNQHGMF